MNINLLLTGIVELQEYCSSEVLHLTYEPPRGKINNNQVRPVQSQKRARSLKFRIKEEEELYYPCSENKGADQLRSYCEADLRLCFRLGRLLVFPCGSSYRSEALSDLSFIHYSYHTVNRFIFTIIVRKRYLGK